MTEHSDSDHQIPSKTKERSSSAATDHRTNLSGNLPFSRFEDNRKERAIQHNISAQIKASATQLKVNSPFNSVSVIQCFGEPTGKAWKRYIKEEKWEDLKNFPNTRLRNEDEVLKKTGHSLIHLALEIEDLSDENFQKVLEIILEHKKFSPQYINLATSEDGNTPLHIAAQKSAFIINILLRNKADVNIRNQQGQTPLHIAAFKGNGPGIDALLKAGADKKIKDNRRKTPYESYTILHSGEDKIGLSLKTEGDTRLERIKQEAEERHKKLSEKKSAFSWNEDNSPPWEVEGKSDASERRKDWQDIPWATIASSQEEIPWVKISKATLRAENEKVEGKFLKGLEELKGLEHESISLIEQAAAIAKVNLAVRTLVPAASTLSSIKPDSKGHGEYDLIHKTLYVSGEFEQLARMMIHEDTHLVLTAIFKNASKPTEKGQINDHWQAAFAEIKKLIAQAATHKGKNPQLQGFAVLSQLPEMSDWGSKQNVSRALGALSGYRSDMWEAEAISHIVEIIFDEVKSGKKDLKNLKAIIPNVMTFFEKDLIPSLEKYVKLRGKPEN